MTEIEDKNRPETIRQKLSLYEILRGINRQSRSMRSKLMVYLCCLVLSGTGILLMMLVASGVFSESGRQIEQNLQVHLQNQKRDIKERMDLFTINGIDLSKRLTKLIKDVLYSLKEAGKTIIITSHHFNQVKDLVDSLYLFGEEHTIKKRIERHEWDNLPTFMEFLDNI